MEDDYQSTLKGKIKILFQLEKWQDVTKLAEQYNEKYGKDVEVDMMRFKSERRLGKTAPAEENKARIPIPKSQAQESSESLAIPEIVAEEEPLLLLPADNVTVHIPTMSDKNEIPATDQPLGMEAKLDNEPFPEVNELLITDPLAEDKLMFSQDPDEPPPEAKELIITDPLAEDKLMFSQDPDEPSPEAKELIITDFIDEAEPVFSPAHNEPPVILIDSGKVENVPIQTEPQAEEMEIVEESPNEFVNTRITFDFKSNPAMAFDAEPALTPAPKAESIAMQINDEDKKLPVESAAANSAVVNESSAESFTEMADEKPQPMNEPYKDFLKKTKSPKKIAFNFKYILVLILPLAAALVLWLALSGKLNWDGGAAEKVSPVSVAEPTVPALQTPIQKVPPAVLIPKTDEKDQLVNEKILQANNFIKNNDILNALAVVIEAKKIKMTEPLRLLEELINKKIQEDEIRVAEQKQSVQSMVQSEDQAYAKAETENTLAAWQNFLILYPLGEFSTQARNKIVVLEKKAAQKAEQELQLKIQQSQKLKLRSDYKNLNQVELNTVLQQLAKPNVQFEQLEHGGAKVIIDFSSGLMWTLWNKPMNFDKAKWWANRIYAGYSGWRLPTVEESLLLRQIGPENYSGLADFAVWTGDEVSDQTRAIWVLKLPEGQFITVENSQACYVWAVRKAGK